MSFFFRFRFRLLDDTLLAMCRLMPAQLHHDAETASMRAWIFYDSPWLFSRSMRRGVRRSAAEM
jgi:hypothetical protein